MTERVTVLGVGAEHALGEEALAALAEAEFVHATRAELAAARGLVPPGAVVDVLGDTAMEDPEGHRWDLPRESARVVVLTPPGDLVWQVVRAIGAHVGPQRVRAIAPAASALVVDPEAGPLPLPPRPLGWALPGERWDAADPLPAVVRAVALAWLGPGPGDTVWDLAPGAGGAVAVESARLGAAAVAVVPDAGAGGRVRANAARHRVGVTVVEGGGSGVLSGLPDPDAVFLTGEVAELVATLVVAAERLPRAVVAVLSSPADADLASDALEGAGLVVEDAAVGGGVTVLRGSPDG